MNLRESRRTMRATLHLLALLATLYFVRGSPIDVPFVGEHPDEKLTAVNFTGRIVNGTKAVLGQFPHQVSLKRSWSERHFCGGSLISASLVLTAGHCVYMNGAKQEPWAIFVVGGIVKLYGNSSTQQRKDVIDIRLHPEFDLESLHNDVAVLQLSDPFTFTPAARSVPLPGFAPTPYTVCQVSGWGYPSSSIPITSPDLMYVDLPIRSVKECRELLKNETDLPPGMFCSGYLEGGRDACQGDSGGGMVCNGILTGIVSGGIGCAQPMLPGVYADVFHYLDWILNGTDVVVVVQKRDLGQTGDYGTSTTSSAVIVIISFLFCAVINYT
ncbi:PREDICTED: trypsin-3-like [Vollenhovia emeryi]|uniref:trypsin-3-like n=1 Tax=Vollenhovia emeryi TaxID=411798 RepID=UPI0005F45AA8|nr:PREDICTED: trypsin-3-like [Vollenhovia emeryi]